MNSVDAGLGVVLFLFAWRGFWRGLVRELFGLLGVALGIACAVVFAPSLAIFFKPYLPLAIGKVVGFGVIFVLTDVAANLIAMGVEAIAGFLFFSALNRAGGSLVGGTKGAIVLAAVLLLLSDWLPGTGLESAIKQSVIGPRLIALASEVARTVGFEAAPGG